MSSFGKNRSGSVEFDSSPARNQKSSKSRERIYNKFNGDFGNNTGTPEDRGDNEGSVDSRAGSSPGSAGSEDGENRYRRQNVPRGGATVERRYV